MNPLEFFIRAVAALGAFVMLVVIWAIVPYLNGVHDIDSGVKLHAPMLSIFFGNKIPGGWIVLLFLVSRAFFGLVIVSLLLIPALRFFADSDFRPLMRAIAIILFGISAAAFLGGLVAQFAFQAALL